MGFGSSGGGFSPSPNNVPGSTKTGTELTDSHEFTGSVQITGSLLLNGSSITPGGGGGGTSPGGLNTYVQYNNGGNFAGSANFTFDGSGISVSQDTDSSALIGRAHIGLGAGGATMNDKAMFAHVDNANSTNFALIQRSNGQTDINAASGVPITFRIGSSIKATLDADAQFGVGGNFLPSAMLHVSSSDGGPLFKVDHPDVAHPDPIVYVTGSGKVGIGTETPTAQLHISSSVDADENLLFRVDHGNHTSDNPIMSITGSGLIGVGTATPAAALHIMDDGAAFLVQSEGASDWFKVQTGQITFNAAGGATYAGGINLGQRFNIAPINASMGALGIGQFPGSDKNVVEVNSTNTDNGGDWFLIDQSGSVGVGTTTPSATVHISASSNHLKLEYNTANSGTISADPFGFLNIASTSGVQLSGAFATVTNDFMIMAPTVPGTAGAAGNPGQIAWDADYIYVCVASNSWKRVAIAAW